MLALDWSEAKSILMVGTREGVQGFFFPKKEDSDVVELLLESQRVNGACSVSFLFTRTTLR